MPDNIRISPLNRSTVRSNVERSKQKVACFDGKRTVAPTTVKRYTSPKRAPVQRRPVQNYKARLSPYEQTTLNRAQRDLHKDQQANNARYKTLEHKINVASNPKALRPVLAEINNPRLFGTYLTVPQKEVLLDAITLKKLEFLPAPPTEKPKPCPPVTGQYNYSQVINMAKPQLKELANKAYGVNALLYYLDIQDGAFNNRLKPSERNNIRVKLLPEIRKAKAKAKDFHYPNLKKELLQARTSHEVQVAEKRLLAVDRLMTLSHYQELHSLLRIAKSRTK